MEAYKLTLHTGSVHSRTLSGLGSAGYDWDFAIEGPRDILSVSEETITPANISLPATFDNDHIFTIKALKQGKARVRLYLHRSWEHNKPPLEEIIIDVLVID